MWFYSYRFTTNLLLNLQFDRILKIHLLYKTWQTSGLNLVFLEVYFVAFLFILIICVYKIDKYTLKLCKDNLERVLVQCISYINVQKYARLWGQRPSWCCQSWRTSHNISAPSLQHLYHTQRSHLNWIYCTPVRLVTQSGGSRPWVRGDASSIAIQQFLPVKNTGPL